MDKVAYCISKMTLVANKVVQDFIAENEPKRDLNINDLKLKFQAFKGDLIQDVNKYMQQCLLEGADQNELTKGTMDVISDASNHVTHFIRLHFDIDIRE
ncbi:hypothetical protein FHW36_112129 [Chitinophaga polysaccharea]|uniref:Uncharacterized protein n=1 Tax=Chitinophaga polysaccharea TaxID=1293035 RepID=A0A561P6E8_9BACT|nr:hypothetical protein [Chitinophaga polysaccharea]TWF33688.1 hypothetical protein FHW36_112129 [Chitinophaga polysaccharea]